MTSNAAVMEGSNSLGRTKSKSPLNPQINLLGITFLGTLFLVKILCNFLKLKSIFKEKHILNVVCVQGKQTELKSFSKKSFWNDHMEDLWT